jgi:predicted PurR-regulated permease PerM
MAVTLTVAFSTLRVPFFLLFAVFIGLTEVIPFIVATLGIGTVAIVVAFIDWWLAFQVLAIAVALQQVKDNLVAPRIMGNLTGLSPVAIFISLLLGAQLGGFLGVILAIPLTGVAKSLAEIVLDPTLPPQTGSFFHNPFADDAVERNSETDGINSSSSFSEIDDLSVSPAATEARKIL